MKRALVSMCLPLALLGCAATASNPDLCTLTQFPVGWAGSEVRVSGLALGAAPHGFVLVANDCDAAIDLRIEEGRLYQMLDAANMEGLVSVTLSGKFVTFEDAQLLEPPRTRGRLIVAGVHAFEVKKMSEARLRTYWEKRLLRRRSR